MDGPSGFDQLLATVNQFLALEARLLDEGRE